MSEALVAIIGISIAGLVLVAASGGLERGSAPFFTPTMKVALALVILLGIWASMQP